MENYTATVAETDYDVPGEVLANIDLSGPFAGKYHLLLDGRSYVCELIDADPYRKMVTVSVDRQRFTVQLADAYDRTVARLGLATSVSQQNDDVTAPMPGLILQLMVAEGDEVEAGTPLLVLEAMKMENVIKAEGSGTVKTVHVTEGEAVDKRQLLIEMQ
ncbi:acetyl-CoA carboxylase biotin carboxyl carrier protein subunit [Lewinella sp. IMCC34183]|uniref:acetyl-CoA carboxylase biotin carboxyl carrier protein subunit n=1 Tax=Lewinella sp. IMCC34183 TaxID=2248762 RepID=UPI000E22DE98|nr:acetyl-CoA carboxylase biotin carboxyl carrier protein subunit [Lewinella sp. IMCC34183]